MSRPTSIFSRLFGDSPITPIKRHMEVVFATAEALRPFCDALLAHDYATANQVRVRICALEQEADDIKKDIRLHLPTGVLRSISRNDLLELVRAQDKIANGIRDLSGLACGRSMRIPTQLAPELRLCVSQAIIAVNALNETLGQLDTLAATGFIQSRTRTIEAGTDSVDDAERLSDQYENSLRSRLFELEDGIDPVDVMFLYQLIDLLGEVADRSQIVADRIRIILSA